MIQANKLTVTSFKTVTDLNDDPSKQTNCDIMKTISTAFDCCGYEGPLNNATTAEDCCKVNKDKTIPKQGCNEKSINKIEKNALNFLIIPSAIILGIEVFVFITVPFLIGRV